MAPYRLRPISSWPGEMTRGRRGSPFRTTEAKTNRELASELKHLEAKDVVLEIAMTEMDFRNDGMPRARAVAEHPGVILSFMSKHGPLRYACDAFTRWEDNVRAVTLALGDLRRVERYGITKRGEQYAGWKQITASSQSAADARNVLRDIVMEGDGSPVLGLTDAALVKKAKRFAHEDAPTGSRRRWDAVQHAAQTLGL